jgi:RNA polymerase sigma-70 factor, ECF subfamily
MSHHFDAPIGSRAAPHRLHGAERPHGPAPRPAVGRVGESLPRARTSARCRDVSWDEVLPVFDEHSRHVMAVPDWSPRVNDPLVQTELRVALTAAINELPATYRTVLVLRDVEDLSNLEIAELLGLSVPLVRTRVHRARLFLRKQLGDAMATLGTDL